MLDKINQQIKQLAEETDKVKTSDFFKTYLKTMSKFWDYSYHNQLLIHSQFPKATKVAGYQTWKKLNRKVVKGEKAIRILAPMIVKEEKKDKIYGFKPVNVFDISQTIGEPLPEINVDIKGENKCLLNKFMLFCDKRKIKVLFKDIENNLYGYNKKELIVINKNKSINTQINTLIHEIAHSILHQDSTLCKQQKEIQAEAVSYVICKHFEIEPRSFDYLALYNADHEKIMNNIEVISGCVKNILGDMLKTV